MNHDQRCRRDANGQMVSSPLWRRNVLSVYSVRARIQSSESGRGFLVNSDDQRQGATICLCLYLLCGARSPRTSQTTSSTSMLFLMSSTPILSTLFSCITKLIIYYNNHLCASFLSTRLNPMLVSGWFPGLIAAIA